MRSTNYTIAHIGIGMASVMPVFAAQVRDSCRGNMSVGGVEVYA